MERSERKDNICWKYYNLEDNVGSLYKALSDHRCFAKAVFYALDAEPRGFETYHEKIDKVSRIYMRKLFLFMLEFMDDEQLTQLEDMIRERDEKIKDAENKFRRGSASSDEDEDAESSVE